MRILAYKFRKLRKLLYTGKVELCGMTKTLDEITRVKCDNITIQACRPPERRKTDKRRMTVISNRPAARCCCCCCCILASSRTDTSLIPASHRDWRNIVAGRAMESTHSAFSPTMSSSSSSSSQQAPTPTPTVTAGPLGSSRHAGATVWRARD